jgi:hypothetical protein
MEAEHNEMANQITDVISAGPKRWLSEGLLLAFLTVGAYWIAFRYEAAIVKTYGFPLQLVELSLVSILVVFLLLSGILWVMFPLVNLISMLWPEHPALQYKAARAIWMLGIPAWHLINYGFRVKDLSFYAIMIGIWIIFEIIWPILFFRDRGSLRDRFIADEIAEEEPRSRTIFGRLQSAIGPLGFGVVLLVLLGGWLAQTAGVAKAKTQRMYLVYASDPTLVAVRLYHDRALCVRINPNTRSIDSILVRPSVDCETELKMQEVGPLQQKALDHH